ncbi:ABC transporter ATP-binding protein [Chitinophaga ginsengisegetis]|uniref:ABC transporter ATP-binding protein n=1 Tax=Chitinophaga ginsengisegetis TaxID=393003 RepID=UPI000DB9C12F|nr:ABC transporter ATP-binding protein [Chitinophaga ginsengisegetis]MDR6570269.1 ATP-binding cassette subfamily B protein [Chitinophaga ginsengisegetis]MDR6650003.1 ATP-binding cassette subfamily B protein [Chitinophaga ginsengisegetis]MDR6656356.1 ATP-binding cassette subfamily B protein [Chitinophaga ginsengisegetis]
MENLAVKKVFDFSLLRRIFSFAAPYKRSFYISMILTVVLAAISPLRPYLIQVTVDKYIAGQLMQMLILVTVVQIGLLLLETVVRFYFSYLTNWLGQSVVKDLRVTVYKKIVHLNLAFFDKTPIGTLTTRTINDIEAINDVFSEGIISIVADLLMIIAILGVMFMEDWRLTLISLSPFPILIFATYIFKESVNKSFYRVRNAVSALNAFVQEHLTGMVVVQAFTAEKREFARFKHINREHRKANIDAIFAYSVFFPVVEIILAISLGLMVWWGANKVLNYEVTQGVMIAFIMYLNMLFRPLRMLADKFNTLQMGMVASERVFKVLDNQDYIPDRGRQSAEKMKGAITFDNVSFAYIDDRYVLKNISFHANPGDTVAIVGHTGSGKTTIISILNRLYEIQKGSIKIDDIELPAYSLESLRSKIGVVLQDVFLFAGSIYDNITLHNSNISRAKVEEASRLIGIHDFIMQLPGGYDYQVMERGSTLSLGQRQLISFVRALLYDPAILVLDEATSSVDTESEMMIQQAIDKLIADRTAIIIAHRLSTISKADKIIVLDKGEIKEMGTHEELLKQEGFYFKLHSMQFNVSKV